MPDKNGNDLTIAVKMANGTPGIEHYIHFGADKYNSGCDTLDSELVVDLIPFFKQLLDILFGG